MSNETIKNYRNITLIATILVTCYLLMVAKCGTPEAKEMFYPKAAVCFVIGLLFTGVFNSLYIISTKLDDSKK